MCDGVNNPVMLLKLIIHQQPAFDSSFIQLEIRTTQIFFTEHMSHRREHCKYHSDLLGDNRRVVLICTGFDGTVFVWGGADLRNI